PHTVVVRTVHHVDDFTTPALIECQNRSIVAPHYVLVPSEYWRRRLRDDFGVDAQVIHNGVNIDDYRLGRGVSTKKLRQQIGAEKRFLFLSVGGIEPRKGSMELIEAIGILKSRKVATKVAVVGGHSFQDHKVYRDRVLRRAEELHLEEDGHLVVLGTVSQEELVGWYRAANAFVFPSVKEGWGLSVLEALAVGLPVVATDIPVFREYLEDEKTALLFRKGDPMALAATMHRIATDANLRDRLSKVGPKVASRYTWESCAEQHRAIYRRLLGERVAGL
ncbi:MAG TPA: glycosyltransferase, partial [Actinomycetota bacterium]|nr:glycosyltransferase [Actinomycetota bacterium]